MSTQLKMKNKKKLKNRRSTQGSLTSLKNWYVNWYVTKYQNAANPIK